MIDKKALATFIESRLEGTDLYLVDLKVTPDNVISVEIDSDTSVDSLQTMLKKRRRRLSPPECFCKVNKNYPFIIFIEIKFYLIY